MSAANTALRIAAGGFVLILAVWIGSELSRTLDAPDVQAIATALPSFPASGPPMALSPSPSAPATTLATSPSATIGATPQPTLAAPTPVATRSVPRLVAGTDGVNARVGPATSFDKIGFLEPGQEATVTGWSNGWWQIEYRGQVAWVSGAYADATGADQIAEPIPPTENSDPGEPSPHLIAGDNGVNVRLGPGVAFDKVGYLEPSAEAPVIARSQGWWQIAYMGGTGWVSGQFVTALGAETVAEVTPPSTPQPTPTLPPAPVWAIDEARWIDVDLSEQRLTAYRGTTPVQSYLVSTGLPQTPTPLGQYRIWIKLRYDDMAGEDYYIKDVPWVMYFYEGYGLHGVTWHANFGHPMSHGCVNQPNDMAEWLFNFSDVGTLVNVHE